MSPSFIKLHGFGNDYIVIESDHLGGVGELGAFAKRICSRHVGAGSDGIAVLSSHSGPDADFGVRIFNPDGSEASLSGNGTRCAAAYLYYQKLWTAEKLRLATRSGIKNYFLLNHTEGKYVFDSELGKPRFDSASIPMVTRAPMEKVIDYPLQVDDEVFSVTALEMGNPNCCMFVDDFNSLDWRRIGRSIEVHRQFPQRTNVIFIRVMDRQQVELRIWERGVGETSSSGTCSCAAAVASMVTGKCDRTITAIMPGGQARICWREDSEVVITGSAEVIYSGSWLAG